MSYEVVNIEVMPDGTWKKINPTNDDASKRISELEAQLAAAQAELEVAQQRIKDLLQERREAKASARRDYYR